MFASQKYIIGLNNLQKCLLRNLLQSIEGRSGPMLMWDGLGVWAQLRLGTKWPSITSTCRTSAPASRTRLESGALGPAVRCTYFRLDEFGSGKENTSWQKMAGNLTKMTKAACVDEKNHYIHVIMKALNRPMTPPKNAKMLIQKNVY